MAPTEYGYDIEDAPRMLIQARLPQDGNRLDNIGQRGRRCELPHRHARCDWEMWDWWFAWHSCESARYKLWHPEAHQYTAVGELRLADHTLTDRQRYIDNVSYVDEYVRAFRPLAIRFLDPSKLGFEDSSPGSTVIAARVGLSVAPIAFGWIVHQVRATDSGAEMRSRFFLNHPQHLDLPATLIVTPPTGRSPVEEVDARRASGWGCFRTARLR